MKDAYIKKYNYKSYDFKILVKQENYPFWIIQISHDIFYDKKEVVVNDVEKTIKEFQEEARVYTEKLEKIEKLLFSLNFKENKTWKNNEDKGD